MQSKIGHEIDGINVGRIKFKDCKMLLWNKCLKTDTAENQTHWDSMDIKFKFPGGKLNLKIKWKMNEYKNLQYTFWCDKNKLYY